MNDDANDNKCDYDKEYRDQMASLPKLKTVTKYNEDGSIRSQCVVDTGEPLYTEEELKRFEIPRFLWHRFDD